MKNIHFKSTICLALLLLSAPVLFQNCGEDDGGGLVIPTDGLVAYYPFNENADDESGFGVHGQAFGAQLVSDRNGKPSSAYFFDGVDDYIRVPHNAGFNFSDNNDFTISVWVKCENQENTTESDNDILSKWFNDDNTKEAGYPFVLRLKNQKSDSESGSNAVKGWYAARNGAGSCSNGGVDAKESIRDNKFHHLVFVKKSTQLFAYQDGKNVGKVSDNTDCETKNNAPLIIGSRKKDGTRAFKGVIDDIRIYNRALSEGEIKALYLE